MDLAWIGFKGLSLLLIGRCIAHRYKWPPNTNPSNRHLWRLEG